MLQAMSIRLIPVFKHELAWKNCPNHSSSSLGGTQFSLPKCSACFTCTHPPARAVTDLCSLQLPSGVTVPGSTASPQALLWRRRGCSVWAKIPPQAVRLELLKLRKLRWYWIAFERMSPLVLSCTLRFPPLKIIKCYMHSNMTSSQTVTVSVWLKRSEWMGSKYKWLQVAQGLIPMDPTLHFPSLLPPELGCRKLSQYRYKWKPHREVF